MNLYSHYFKLRDVVRHSIGKTKIMLFLTPILLSQTHDVKLKTCEAKENEINAKRHKYEEKLTKSPHDNSNFEIDSLICDKLFDLSYNKQGTSAIQISSTEINLDVIDILSAKNSGTKGDS